MLKFYRIFQQTLIHLLISNVITVLAQTTCNNGLGRVLYERLPNQQLQGFDDDVVRDTAPPFRVLEKCQDLCLRDRTASNNLVRACTSFDFQPGSRIASFSGSAEYEESTCYLTREQAAPEGIGNLMLVPNSVHFTEVCLTSSRPERECPSRRYVFERHPRKKLKLPLSDIKEITAANRSDCEDKCLNEFSFVCRSANFDTSLRTCSLSRFTRRTHPELLEDDANSDYLENTCLNAERRCDGLAVFVKEENKRLGGPFEVDIFNNMTLEECQTMCLRAEKYFCRSVEFDDQTKQCILSEEDSISQKDDISISSSPTHHFYDLVCLDNQRGTDYPDNSVTSHLFSSGRRPDTAFQRYRNSRLGGEFHSEITGRSLSECLDECLRQTSFQCRSAVYSDRFRTCRLSRYNQRDGMRIIYDADYDYYENLMLNVVGSDNDDRQSPRPDTNTGTDWRPPKTPASNYPGDRNKYPSDRNPMTPDYDRYPAEKYPGDRYPAGDSDRDRYPDGDRYGGDRYPGMDRDRYPGMDRDRYPGMDRDRYPGMDRDRYPGMDRDRYPGMDRDRYPGMDQDRYRPDDRYAPDERYPGDRDRDRFPGGGYDRERYPMGGGGGGRYPDRGNYPTDRYPPERYPPITDNRYPSDVDRYRPRPYLPPADSRDRFPYYGSGERYPPGSRFPPDDGFSERYPSSRFPPRYPIDSSYGGRGDRPPIRVPGSRFPPDDDFSERYPSSRFPPRYPIDSSYGGRGDRPPIRASPGGRLPIAPLDGPRYPAESPRYPPDDIAGSRRPPIDPARYPDTDKRYPLSPVLPTTDNKFPPTSANRFPVGTDRYPIDIYKYGNRERFPSGSGFDRFPPSSYYDLEYEDRFNDRPYGPRPGYSAYGSAYDREYDGGYGRRPMGGGGYPQYEGYRPSIQSGYDNSINSVSGDGFGGYGPIRPHSSRCDDVENFKQMASRRKMRRQYIRRSLTVPTLLQCQRECIESRDFMCRSFNYRETTGTYDDRDLANCELSDRDSRELDLHNSNMFDSGTFDYYEKSSGRNGIDGECLDVSQVCNEEGMEFTLRTPEGFAGRIYTYGFYDRCFFRGNGGTVNVLKISGPQGYPECGTQKYGDTLTNIVVVQFSDNVQTGRDKRFNLTCVFRGPGEAVVTSSYIGAGSGSPIPIEYLPAENTLSSKVRLMILYQGRPTTTIAVGDPLTFRLEAQDGYNQVTDIFATNVVARDPYSGRSIQLIDRFGCPVDPFVFPELDKLREGDMLEARFNAFKIPESNFLVFEATVRTCREGCQPAYCPGPAGRSEPSFGRRRRSLNDTDTDMIIEENIIEINNTISDDPVANKTENANENGIEEPEHVREMIEVFESRDEIEQESFARKLVAPVETVCMTPSEYHGLITAVILLMILLFSITLVSGLAYRRYWKVMSKNRSVDRSSPINLFVPSTIRTHEPFNEPSQSNASRRPPILKPGGMSFFGNGLQKTFATGNLSRMCQIPVMNPIRNNTNNFDDPSEPIYTDPSLFERSRSLRSLSEEGRNEV